MNGIGSDVQCSIFGENYYDEQRPVNLSAFDNNAGLLPLARGNKRAPAFSPRFNIA
jgi:hypothetical protein